MANPKTGYKRSTPETFSKVHGLLALDIDRHKIAEIMGWETGTIAVMAKFGSYEDYLNHKRAERGRSTAQSGVERLVASEVLQKLDRVICLLETVLRELGVSEEVQHEDN